MDQERTVVIVKPDGIRRGLAGEIISRFEKTGLKLVACKLLVVPPEMATKHYAYNEEWFLNIGNKILKFYEEHGKDVNEDLGTKDPMEIGKYALQKNVEYLTEGPVLAMIWQGPHAVEIVRKIIGSTYPQQAPPGTIRGDFGHYSASLANATKTPAYNLVHASGNVEEAEFEVKLWFKEKEINSW
ncbi:MAG: nucleoside-diphosphate kinase [Patescibacteria group bacterium]